MITTRRQQRAIAGHPVFAALNRGPLSDEDLRHLAATELLALRALAEGRATVAECLDLRDLIATGVELARAGVGVELLPVAQAVLRDLLTALVEPQPVQAAAGILERLHELRDLLAEQRRLATRAEWIRCMQAVALRPRVA